MLVYNMANDVSLGNNEVNTMKKVLIIYASKTGTTQDVSTSLAADLAPFCDTYDCCQRAMRTAGGAQESVKAHGIQWADYEIVVLGTAMYMGRPMKELKKFCIDQETILLTKKLILFTCGIGTQEEDKTYLWRHLPKSITQQALFYSHLGGEIRKARMSPLARVAMSEYVKEHGDAPGINRMLVDEMIETIKKYL